MSNCSKVATKNGNTKECIKNSDNAEENKSRLYDGTIDKLSQNDIISDIISMILPSQANANSDNMDTIEDATTTNHSKDRKRKLESALDSTSEATGNSNNKNAHKNKNSNQSNTNEQYPTTDTTKKNKAYDLGSSTTNLYQRKLSTNAKYRVEFTLNNN